MPAVSQLATRILWSWIIAVTAVVLETSAKAPVRAESPGVVAADNGTSLQASVANETNPRSLQLGLLPYLSPEALIATHRPLVEYLERRLQRPVTVLTAPDFHTYLQRALADHYDLYFTAPHFAALAESRYRHRRLARWSKELYGTMVVAKQSAYQHIEGLRGTIIATPDPLAVITILCELTLIEYDLVPGEDVTMKYLPSHNSALLAVAEGRAEMAVSSNIVYASLDPALKNQLRLLMKTKEIPAAMFMAKPSMRELEYQELKAVLLDYPSDKTASATFFKVTGIRGIIPISDNDMKVLAPLLPILESRQRK